MATKKYIWIIYRYYYDRTADVLSLHATAKGAKKYKKQLDNNTDDYYFVIRKVPLNE